MPAQKFAAANFLVLTHGTSDHPAVKSEGWTFADV